MIHDTNLEVEVGRYQRARLIRFLVRANTVCLKSARSRSMSWDVPPGRDVERFKESNGRYPSLATSGKGRFHVLDV